MDFKFLTSERDIKSLIDWHNKHTDYVALDTETTSKIARQAKLIDVQMSGRSDEEVVMFSGEHLPLVQRLTAKAEWWNAKYDLIVAYLHGVDLRCLRNYDGMLLHHLQDENLPHDLDSIIQADYNDPYKQLFWEKYESYQDAPFDERLSYACKDVFYLRRVNRKIRAALQRDGIPESLQEHVHRLALSLLATELHGIKCDLEYTVRMGTELKADIVETEPKMREAALHQCEIIELQQWAKEIEKVYKPGPRAKKWMTIQKPEFNFQSTQQVSQLLYEELGLPPQMKWDRKTRQEKPTTEDDALEVIEHHHPVVPLLRGYKKKTKMYGSFIEGVLEKVQGDTLYPSFNVNGTVTGRISHSEPNMGQMPSKGEWVKIRGIFVPEPGHKLITCDYGQLEVVIAAHFSQDKNLLRIINEGESKHDITARELGIPRAVAKTVNFAQQYLCQPAKVAEIIGCSKKDGEYYWNKYWETYAGEKAVVDACAAKVDRGEDIVNPFGRRRRFPKEFKGPWDRAKAHRQAYSSLIQGTGSDITSRALYLVSEWLSSRGYGRAWFSLHDELILQALLRHVDETRERVQKTMVGIGEEIGLTLPLTVDCSEGLERWQK